MNIVTETNVLCYVNRSSSPSRASRHQNLLKNELYRILATKNTLLLDTGQGGNNHSARYPTLDNQDDADKVSYTVHWYQRETGLTVGFSLHT